MSFASLRSLFEKPNFTTKIQPPPTSQKPDFLKSSKLTNEALNHAKSFYQQRNTRYSSSNSNVITDSILTVSQLRKLFEKLAQENGWTNQNPMYLMGLIRKRVEDETNGKDIECVIRDVMEEENEKNNLSMGSTKKLEMVASAAEPENMSLTKDVTKSSKEMTEIKMPNILTPTRKKKSHDCDMIVCGVKSFAVNGHKVHEIDLKCHGCESEFVLTAAHDCENDGESGDDEAMMIENGEAAIEKSSTNRGLNRGLEWLKDDGLDCLNIII